MSNPSGLVVQGLPTVLDDVVSYAVHSGFQAEPTLIRLLIPQPSNAPVQTAVVVLPVEPRTATRFGDSLRTLQQLNLHERYHVLIIAPTFSAMPWLADHPTEPTLRQEQYLLKHMLSFIEQLYPEIDTRLLLGFSKSGYGCCTLLLRHPDLFQAAAIWDAPLMQAKPDVLGMAQIYGTDANFASYRIPDLLRQRAYSLQGRSRLALFGYKVFREHMSAAHELLNNLNIPHHYENDVEREHRWDSGWIPDAFDALMSMK